MQRYLAEGFAAAEAAALANGAPGVEVEPPLRAPAGVRAELQAALDVYDEPRAQAALDRLQATATLDAALSDVLLPYLRELGERWRRGDVSVGQEHSPRASCAGVCSASRAAGTVASDRVCCSPVHRGSSTTSA